MYICVYICTCMILLEHNHAIPCPFQAAIYRRESSMEERQPEMPALKNHTHMVVHAHRCIDH